MELEVWVHMEVLMAQCQCQCTFTFSYFQYFLWTMKLSDFQTCTGFMASSGPEHVVVQ